MSNNNINPDPYEDVVNRNRYGIRSLEAKFLQNEYERMTAAKNVEKMQQKQQKVHELDMLNQLNDNYMNEMSEHRRRKVREQKSLSVEYEEFIKNKDEKGRYNRNSDQSLEKSSLLAPTWIRDVFAERQTYRKNMDHYNKSLSDHVRLQQIRKEAERQEQMMRMKKIDQQADQILKKERYDLEARHRQKSLFEKRQNDLLGVKSQNNEGIGASGMLPQDTVMRRKQQDLYSQGLQIQLRNEQEKRNTNPDKVASPIINVYNPITNPMPFVYKNPNVLRMMAHN